MFTKDFFANNRRQISKQVGEQVIVISANGLLQSSGDMTFPFKQNSNFWYLTGINEPDAVLVISDDGEFIILPERDKTRIIFDGDVDREEMSAISGIDQIYGDKEGWRKLGTILSALESISTILPPRLYVKQAGLYTNPAAASLRRRLKKINSSLEFNDLRQKLADMRVIKQTPEIETIQKAIDITVDSFDAAMSRRRDYTHEYQLEAAVESGFRSRGAVGSAFPSIVAGGQNACTLHYSSNKHKLNPQDLVLVDAGASCGHYAADLTRTFSLGTPSNRQQAVFDAVLGTQLFAINLLKPGLELHDYAKQVDDYCFMQLKKIGLVKNNNQKYLRQYFPHAVSHFLGLDVHDGRGWDKPLAAGMVLTVEPGIYIPEEGIGIRIEDNVLITPKGNRVMSQKLAKKLL